MASNLVLRIAVSAIAIPAAVALIWLGGWALAAALAVLGVLGAKEVYDLARRQAIDPLDRTGFALAAGIPLFIQWQSGGAPIAYVGAAWLLAALVITMWRRPPAQRPLPVIAVTLFGAVYASGLLAFLLAIRHGPGAERNPSAYLWLSVVPLAITWICDTAAMAAGTRFGGARLAPVLSPNKTRVGAVAGFVAAVAAAILLGVFVLNGQGWHFSVWQMAVLGAVVGVAAQVGDVVESLFKREAGVKDSSAVIPGHGGVLDRLDSLYFVLPCSAVVYRLFGVI